MAENKVVTSDKAPTSSEKGIFKFYEMFDQTFIIDVDISTFATNNDAFIGMKLAGGAASSAGENDDVVY